METFWNVIEPVVITVLLSLVAMLIGQGFALLRRRTSQEQFGLIQRIAAQAVKMAEQLSTDNADKKLLAVSHAQLLLERYGIKLDLIMLEEVIEAAVFSELKQQLAADG